MDHFLHLFVAKTLLMFEKTEYKQKRDREQPILKKTATYTIVSSFVRNERSEQTQNEAH